MHFSVGFLAVLVLPVVAILAATLGLLVRDGRKTPSRSETAARANRHAMLTSIAGLVLMVGLLLAAFYALGVFGFAVGQGRLVAVSPAIAAAALLVAQAVGELTWPHPSGVEREAELVARNTRDVAPRRYQILALAWAGISLFTLGVCSVVASGPREISRTLAAGGQQTVSPFPGSYFGLPMAVSIVLIVVGTELVLRLIAWRPAVVAVSREWDTRLRRRSAGNLLRGVQLVLALTLAGVLAIAGRALRQLGDQWIPNGGTTATSPGLAGLGFALLVTALVVP